MDFDKIKSKEEAERYLFLFGDMERFSYKINSQGRLEERKNGGSIIMDNEKELLQEFNKYIKTGLLTTSYGCDFEYTKGELSGLLNITLLGMPSGLLIDSFKYLLDGATVNIKLNKLENINLKELVNLLNRLDKLNKKIYVELKLKDFNYSEINDSGILDYKYNNMKIAFTFIDGYATREYNTLEEYKKVQVKLDEMIKDVKDSNLSPYEKYIAVYNMVTRFRKYKESPFFADESRQLLYILFGKYIVCSGYVRLLDILLDRVGIKTTKQLYVDMDSSYMDGFNLEEKVVTKDGHMRLLVNLDDDKYNIHGIYIADPTWDNSTKTDYLVHANMTIDSMRVSSNLFYLSGELLLLDIHNFQEYQEQVDYLFKKILGNSKKTSENIMKTYNQIVLLILDLLLKLDEEVVRNIYDKYHNGSGKYICKDEETYQSFITEIGHYIVSKVNNPISKDVMFRAYEEEKKQFSNKSIEEIKMLKSRIIKNYKRDEKKFFPYLIDDNGNLKSRKNRR